MGGTAECWRSILWLACKAGVSYLMTMLFPKPGPSWRKARIAARLLLKKAARQPWSDRDRSMAARLHEDPAVTNRLIDQAYHSISARRRNGYSILHRLG